MSSLKFVKIVLQMIMIVHLVEVNYCNSFNHTAGNRQPFGSDLLHQGELFKKTSFQPKSYGIAFKYHANSFSGPPFFVQLNVNGAENSLAKIEHSHEIDSTRDRTVDALVNIENASNLTASIEVRGISSSTTDAFENFAYLIGRKTFKPRSYAAICIHNSTHRSYHGNILEMGERKPGDGLLYLQHHIVNEKIGKFPRFMFDFDDRNVSISQIRITASIPTVVVFKNKVLMNDHRFRATIYGLSSNTFEAALIIFGTISTTPLKEG